MLYDGPGVAPASTGARFLFTSGPTKGRFLSREKSRKCVTTTNIQGSKCALACAIYVEEEMRDRKISALRTKLLLFITVYQIKRVMFRVCRANKLTLTAMKTNIEKKVAVAGVCNPSWYPPDVCLVPVILLEAN